MDASTKPRAVKLAKRVPRWRMMACSCLLLLGAQAFSACTGPERLARSEAMHWTLPETALDLASEPRDLDPDAAARSRCWSEAPLVCKCVGRLSSCDCSCPLPAP